MDKCRRDIEADRRARWAKEERKNVLALCMVAGLFGLLVGGWTLTVVILTR